MIIKSKFKDYSVSFETSLDFIKELTAAENAEFVIDKNVYELYSEWFTAIPNDRLFILEATEKNKVIDTALDICEKMTSIPAKRNAVLISVGGGIVQDITGFVANILYRGIKWIFVPTTLLASCDSCIGGKTSLNYKTYKNLLGTFYPPDAIHICSNFFKTLTDKDYKSGLGEVIKFNIMAGQAGLDNISSSIDCLIERNGDCAVKFMKSSLEFKKLFIEADEFDKGERIKLNFAHTFGHAIEVVTKYNIPHGTAVAIGMIMANKVSVNRGILSYSTAISAERVLMKAIDIDISWLDVPLESVVSAMKKDKKQVGDSLTAVLMTDYTESGGNLIIVNDITASEIEDAIRHFKNIYID